MLQGFHDWMQDSVEDERQLFTTYGNKLNEILTSRAAEKEAAEKAKNEQFVELYLASNPSAKQTSSGLIYNEKLAGTGTQV
jgi:FKBP-type peptidyl-prolyl cis-trans isomerase